MRRGRRYTARRTPILVADLALCRLSCRSSTGKPGIRISIACQLFANTTATICAVRNGPRSSSAF
ncbi:hypothetical protein P355_2788 [Burkholderia cenocepacia KC-01]|nr:hypothetical protein P355_2788 [Burkholderia cenocepacia KC-01]